MLLVSLDCTRSHSKSKIGGGSYSIFDYEHEIMYEGLYNRKPRGNIFSRPIEKFLSIKRNLSDLYLHDDIKFAISELLSNGVRTTIDDNLIQKLITKVG